MKRRQKRLPQTAKQTNFAPPRVWRGQRIGPPKRASFDALSESPDLHLYLASRAFIPQILAMCRMRLVRSKEPSCGPVSLARRQLTPRTHRAGRRFAESSSRIPNSSDRLCALPLLSSVFNRDVKTQVPNKRQLHTPRRRHRSLRPFTASVATPCTAEHFPTLKAEIQK